MTVSANFAPMPDAAGFFGPYGGQLVPPHLKQAMDDINSAYAEITQRQDFQDELAQLFADYVGRPSPIFHFTMTPAPNFAGLRRSPIQQVYQ